MTRIPVSDAAVEAAMIAWREVVFREGTTNQEAVRAAIEAALPELLEHFGSFFRFNDCDWMHTEANLNSSPVDGLQVNPAYRLRHPTPGREGQDNG